MISVFINLFVAAACLLGAAITAGTGDKPNGNILLGVTLPLDVLKDERVLAVTARYRHAYMRVFYIFAALALPFIFVSAFVSVSILYMVVYIAGLFYFYSRVSAKYTRMLYTLKKENGWWVGERHEIAVDTEVSRLRATFPVSAKWFMMPLAIHAAAILLRPSPVTICGAVALPVYFFAFLLFNRDRTVVYSANTDINLAINRVYKRAWSTFWVLAAVAQGVCFAAMVWLTDPVMTVALVCALTLAVVVLIMRTYEKIRREKNRLSALENENVFADNDEYWLNGMFYNNPYDNRAWVEKRMGYGMTVNMAKSGAKMAAAALFGLVTGGVLWLALFLTPLDFGAVELSVADNMATIDAPLATFNFQTGSIRSVALLDDLPKAAKVRGGDAERFYSGTFNVEGYGQSHVYVHCGRAPYIAVELDGGWVFLNGATEAVTRGYFAALR